MKPVSHNQDSLSRYYCNTTLASFGSLGQEGLIGSFRDLDEHLALAAQTEVRKRVFGRFPDIHTATVRSGELGILRSELAKRRRRSVRKLLATIPVLIQTIKPCFLVSPLAVSQYLPLSDTSSEAPLFDVVIFDEASQVLPEDAVPSILRGKQLILAGDQKQLPPSNFWGRSLGEGEADGGDDGDDGQSNQLADRDSILDAGAGLRGQLFDEAHLNVHYRSRDESLIRFSNHCFYADQLLTFPSPGFEDPWCGVHGVYVAEARYDAGATRTNRKEAERVVELVFQHMRGRPIKESIGVAALSRPQADLIEKLIEERRILERDAEARFDESLDEPFFVKNLENVQGDERDHIVISIGYGPTVASGAVPNRFGPLNVSGGERRLNVLVTRARQRVSIVHSIRTSDIRSEQLGPRLLRRYLEYVDDPRRAFESEVTLTSSAEPESPFEAAVAQALVTKGYRVASQVGVSGYRIDLAILSEDGTHCDLGIECDGWTYHSAPSARDRDWLRQKVLEGLGWKIHRVWSTAWVRNPDDEMARIEASLALARARSMPSAEISDIEDRTISNPPSDSAVREASEGEFVEVSPCHTADIELQDYQRARLIALRSAAGLQHELLDKLVRMVVGTAEIEGPVHRDVVIDRIRETYRMTKLRGSSRDRVEEAIALAQRGGRVRSSGEFIWVWDDQLTREPRKPVDGDIAHVAPSEIRTVLLAVAMASFGCPRRTLVQETARKLGFSRTGGRISDQLDV